MRTWTSFILLVFVTVLTACGSQPMSQDHSLPTREDVRAASVGAVKAGPTYYFSGIVGTDPETKELPPSMGEQTTVIMQRFQAGLEELGMSWNNVVKANVYITDMSLKPEMNKAYGAALKGYKRPARVCVKAGLEGDPLVEIAIIAVQMTD